jgi:hypothetical protein
VAPDLLPSAKHPLPPAPIAHVNQSSLWESSSGGQFLFKFAHLSKNVSSTVGSDYTRLNAMHRVGNLTAEAIAGIEALL